LQKVVAGGESNKDEEIGKKTSGRNIKTGL